MRPPLALTLILCLGLAACGDEPTQDGSARDADAGRGASSTEAPETHGSGGGDAETPDPAPDAGGGRGVADGDAVPAPETDSTPPSEPEKTDAPEPPAVPPETEAPEEEAPTDGAEPMEAPPRDGDQGDGGDEEPVEETPPPVDPPTRPEPPIAVPPDEEDWKAPDWMRAAEYVGADACKKCHFKQHRYWKKTRLAGSLATLGPTSEADDAPLVRRKVEAGLDPARDYRRDAKCLPCHTTGYGLPAGYPVDREGAAAARLDDLGRVGCESCHGPGGSYVKEKTAALEADKDVAFTAEQLTRMGVRKPRAEDCRTCHQKLSPTSRSESFDFEREKGKVHSKN